MSLPRRAGHKLLVLTIHRRRFKQGAHAPRSPGDSHPPFRGLPCDLRFLRLLGAGLLVAAGLVIALPRGIGADDKEAIALDSEHPRLVEQSTRLIREALKDKPNRRAADKARIAAMLIAASAQQNLAGPDGSRRAALRDAALDLADSIKDEDFAKARQRVQELPGLKRDPQAKKEKVKLLGPAPRYRGLDDAVSGQ